MPQGVFANQRFRNHAAFRFDSSRYLNSPSNLTDMILPTRRQGGGVLTTSGREPRPAGPAQMERQMFQGDFNLEHAVPVEASDNADVLFELGLLYASGRSVGLDLVSAHKWFNLAALKGRVDALAHRREVAEQMSDIEIARAQREATRLDDRALTPSLRATHASCRCAAVGSEVFPYSGLAVSRADRPTGATLVFLPAPAKEPFKEECHAREETVAARHHGGRSDHVGRVGRPSSAPPTKPRRCSTRPRPP